MPNYQEEIQGILKVKDHNLKRQNKHQYLTYLLRNGKWSGSVVSNSLQPMGCTERLLCPWDFPGNNTGVGCHFLLQGIFLTKGSNLDLPHCRETLYPLSHWNYQTENLKQLCDVQGQEMDFSAQNREYTLLLPFLACGEGVCYWSIWTLKAWAMSTHPGEGGTSLLSRLIQMLISPGNTLTDTLRNNFLPAIWASLSPVKLSQKSPS